MLRLAGEHLFLAMTALLAGIAVAVPLGVVAAKRRRLEHVILSTAEIIQTIPGLALLVLLMPPVRELGLRGTGPAPVIIALFLYSLLPIIRNTFTGIRDIPLTLRESAAVLGLSPSATLWQVELPLASRTILAGIKTTAVMSVGYATLGGLIGAGGFGQPITEGLAADDARLMMEGAVPAAILALLVKLLFELVERWIVPKGLRVASGR
jgi:osmoprotectant transport system permease protein